MLANKRHIGKESVLLISVELILGKLKLVTDKAEPKLSDVA